MNNAISDPQLDPRPLWGHDIPHYYGDIERRLFLGAAFIMLVSLFFFHEYIALSLHLSLLSIILLAFVAGLLSPRQQWLALLNTSISLLGVIAFGLAAFASHSHMDAELLPVALPWTNLVLAVGFLFALYFSVKTLRWRFSKGKIKLEHQRLEHTQ